MHKILSFLIIGILSFGLIVSEASAKRFGGGRSFGTQRSFSTFSPSYNKSQPVSSAIGKNANTRKWGGILGGLLVGGLLASLFMSNGITSGILSWLLVGGVILLLISLFRRRTQPSWQTSQQNGAFSNNFQNMPFGNKTATDRWPNAFNNSPSPEEPAENFNQPYPDGFVAETFLRDAKAKFIRLQAAYDQKNLEDLREFTSPEVFAEIKLQLEERGNAENHTEIVTLEAKLLDVATEMNTSQLASVRFTGAIKEENNPAVPLDEIWHFRRFSGQENWVVSGIQQEMII